MTVLDRITTHGRITLKQGGGGRAMRSLIEQLFIKDFAAMPFDGVGLGAMEIGRAHV